MKRKPRRIELTERVRGKRRKLRREMEIPIWRVAERIPVSESTLSKWERGIVTHILPSTLQAWDDALDALRRKAVA